MIPGGLGLAGTIIAAAVVTVVAALVVWNAPRELNRDERDDTDDDNPWEQ